MKLKPSFILIGLALQTSAGITFASQIDDGYNKGTGRYEGNHRCSGLTLEQCRAKDRRAAQSRQEMIDNFRPNSQSSQDTSCDMGQLHDEMIERFKLPEIPSSLSDCGIGGFLNFDFSFNLGDFDFSSLFCDFAQDVVGNFKENMSIDFDIGMNGISINSPIYSMQTKGADEAVNELLYGATGVDQNGRGVLGNISDAYRDTLQNVKRDLTSSSNNGRQTRSFTDVSREVRQGSAYSLDDMRRNIDAIQEIETTGTRNTRSGNTGFVDMNGNRQTIGGDASSFNTQGLNLTSEQVRRFTSMPYDQIRNLSERELEQYLQFTEAQKQGAYSNRNSSSTRGTNTNSQPQRNPRDPANFTAPIRVENPPKDNETGKPIYIGEPVEEVKDNDAKSRLTELLFNRKER